MPAVAGKVAPVAVGQLVAVPAVAGRQLVVVGQAAPVVVAAVAEDQPCSQGEAAAFCRW